MTGSSVLALVLAVAPVVSEEERGEPDDEPSTEVGIEPAPAPEAMTEVQIEAAVQEAFAAGDYDRMAELAARAYTLTREARHLYAQAHAERFRGNCQAALALYARVMAAEPEADLGEYARDSVGLCEAEIEDDGSAAAIAADDAGNGGDSANDSSDDRSEDAGPVRPPTRSQAGSTDAPRRHWRKDPLGGVAVGLGSAAIAAGTALTIASVPASNAANASTNESDYERHRIRSDRRVLAGALTLTAGALLVAGGVARYAKVARRLRVQGGVGSSAVSIGLSGRF